MNQSESSEMCSGDPKLKIVMWVLFAALMLPIIWMAFQMCVHLLPQSESSVVCHPPVY